MANRKYNIQTQQLYNKNNTLLNEEEKWKTHNTVFNIAYSTEYIYIYIYYMMTEYLHIITCCLIPKQNKYFTQIQS